MSLYLWKKTVDATDMYAVGEPDVRDGEIVGLRLRSVCYESEAAAIADGWVKYALVPSVPI